MWYSMLNYEYSATNSKEEKPEGVNWEFWGMRITPDEEKSVWRREKSEELE